jgi:hypothetical protein
MRGLRGLVQRCAAIAWVSAALVSSGQRATAQSAGAPLELTRFRIRAALNTQASGNAFVQYNSTTNRLDFNVRLRYAFAEGTDLWLVYNEGLDTDPLRDLAGVRGPTSLARTLLLKYRHTVGF